MATDQGPDSPRCSRRDDHVLAGLLGLVAAVSMVCYTVLSVVRPGQAPAELLGIAYVAAGAISSLMRPAGPGSPPRQS
jgi:drug/metabolite transporter (DMT)-like permease